MAIGNGTALKLSRELISRKIDGQAAIVRDMFANSAAADEILRFKGELAETDDIDAVRLVEAQTARLYWSQWSHLPIQWPQKDQDLIPAHWKVFGFRVSPITRSPRLAANAPNACMNLIHALCESECRIALISMGLNPQIGLLHCDAPSRSSLANDLQEVLRPAVDSFMLNWIQTERFCKRDFWEDSNGNCRIRSTLAKRLCETADTWRKLAAPAAEWMAREFWKTIRRPDTPFPTRLTHDNKRTVKGAAPLGVSLTPAPQHLCEGCGKVVGKSVMHCAGCANEVRSERMRAIAQRGRVASKSSESRARLASTQRLQRKARKNWDALSQPDWLTEEFYSTTVRPLLIQCSLSRIANALGVSIPYASDIRKGRRRPHARHWQALASLVGVVEERFNSSN